MSKYDSTTNITDYDVNWKKIKSACMTTISKDAGDKEPSQAWKRKLLMAEHSPIRRGIISWYWPTIPSCISTHFARHHMGCEKFVATSREDRTGVPREERSQMDYVRMEMDANIQALINISRKRLCTCADPTTRQYWKSLLEEVKKYDEDIYWACVPECIRTGSCPEYVSCGFYEAFSKQLTPEEQMNIHARYDKYYQMRERGVNAQNNSEGEEHSS